MSKASATLVCTGLLAVALAAFVVAERAKTELTPIYGTKIDKVFSPVCDLRFCLKRSAAIVFKLRGRRHYLEVWIDRGGARVRTIVPRERHRDGIIVLAFDGRTAAGRLLSDGVYVPVIRVDSRTYVLPDQIRLVTKPPRVISAPHGAHAKLFLGARGHRGILEVAYAVNEPAHAVLLIGGRQVEFTRFQHLRGTLSWNGTMQGRPLHPGRYRVAIAAQDAAGNRSQPLEIGTVMSSPRPQQPIRTRVPPALIGKP